MPISFDGKALSAPGDVGARAACPAFRAVVPLPRPAVRRPGISGGGTAPVAGGKAPARATSDAAGWRRNKPFSATDGLPVPPDPF
jgi:hypothetical protein